MRSPLHLSDIALALPSFWAARSSDLIFFFFWFWYLIITYRITFVYSFLTLRTLMISPTFVAALKYSESCYCFFFFLIPLILLFEPRSNPHHGIWMIQKAAVLGHVTASWKQSETWNSMLLYGRICFRNKYLKKHGVQGKARRTGILWDQNWGLTLLEDLLNQPFRFSQT